MKQSMALVATIAAFLGTSASAADLGSTDEFAADDQQRRGVLCGVWVTRTFVDRLIGADQDAKSFSQTTYPVPAPLWLAQSINSAYLALRN